MRDIVIRIEAVARHLTEAMAYISGAAFLLLSLYITWDVLGRKFGFPYSGVTDDVSGYTLAVAGTWAMAHTMRTGGHVRIDILLHLFPPRLRTILSAWGLAMAAWFSGMLAMYSWSLAQESYEIDARGISMLQAPLAIPQALVALGLTVLTAQTALLCLLTIMKALPRRDVSPASSTIEI